MVEAVVAVRFVLSLVLAAAALAKLAARQDLRQAATDLGVPTGMARIVGWLLAPVELALAVLLLPGVTGYGAAIATLLLFVAFTALIGSNLRRGNTPSCACFGASSDEPISNTTLVRNVALAGAAAWVVVAGPALNEGVLATATEVVEEAGAQATLAALGLAVAGLWAAVAALYLRQTGEAHATVSGAGVTEPGVGAGLPPGSRAPNFTLESVDGLRVTLADLLRREKPVVLIFTDSACRPCNDLLPELADSQHAFAENLTIALVSGGTLDENRAKATQFDLRDVLVQGGDEVASAYRYDGTPGAVLIDRDGRILTRVGTAARGVRDVLQAARILVTAPEPIDPAKPRRSPVAVPIGEPAPPLRLPSLSGGDIDLVEFQGRVAVLLFWSPTCGYCSAIREDVQAWERNEQSAQLVVVSTGSRGANQAQRFASPVLLDEGGASVTAFGADGTPAAVLVDAAGRVASPVALGTDEVLALLDRASTLARLADTMPIER